MTIRTDSATAGHGASTMRFFLAALCFAALAAGSRCEADDLRPNVLFLFTDDQRHDTIRALGNDGIVTPHLDQLVSQGTSFRNAYIMGGSSPAVCSPSRASLMTGRTLWNIECQGLFGFEISARFKTLPQVFRESGYETFATGKNEPGKHGAFARSFSCGESILFKGMTKSQSKLQLHDFLPRGDYASVKAATRTGRHSAEVYADACLRFLNGRKDADKPFFCYVAFQTPHDPLDVPDEYLAVYDGRDIALWEPFLPQHPFDNGMLDIRDEKLEQWPRTRDEVARRLRAYYASITHTDAQIGRILDALEAQGLSDKTIVVFASDNGLAMGSHGLLGKQNVYEHSVKVPLILAGPGIPKGEQRGQLTYAYDVFPTLCELAGIEIPETVQYQSLKPVIDDAAAGGRSHLYFAFMEWQRAIRDDRYKLIAYCVAGERTTQLFDLHADPAETHNLASRAEHAKTLARLRGELESERVLHNDGNTPYEFSNAQGRRFWAAYRQAEASHSP